MRLEIGRQPGNTNNPTVCLVTQLAPDYKLICPHRHFFLTFYMDAKESNSASHACTCWHSQPLSQSPLPHYPEFLWNKGLA